MEAIARFYLPWSPPTRLSNAVYPTPVLFPAQRSRTATKALAPEFLGGGIGYVAWEALCTSSCKTPPNRTPIGPAATLALIGDAADGCALVRGCYFKVTVLP